MSIESEFVRQVEGQLCYEFKVVEHWFQGTRLDPWTALFLRIADGCWVRFFFDAGVFFWKLEAPSLPEAFEGNEYRLVTPQIAGAIEGRKTVSADFSQLSGGGRTLTLTFDDEAMLHFINEGDRSVAFIGGKR